MKLFDSVAKIAIFTVLIASAAGLMLFAFKGKIEEEAKSINEKRSMLTVLEKRNENIIALKADYPLVKENLSILRQALPTEKNIDLIVNDLENLALQTNNVQNLNFLPLNNLASIGSIKAVNFSVSLSGNISSFINYLNGIKKLPYFVEIGSVSVANEGGVLNNNTRLNLNAKVYIRNQY